MRVNEILERKEKKTIETISPQASIAEAADNLTRLRIGVLIASEDGNSIAGILSERDIVRIMSKSGANCFEESVANVMTKNVKTINSEESVQEALTIMTEGKFRHLPVVDNGQLIGLITIGDAVAVRLDQVEKENNALNEMISGAVY